MNRWIWLLGSALILASCQQQKSDINSAAEQDSSAVVLPDTTENGRNESEQTTISTEQRESTVMSKDTNVIEKPIEFDDTIIVRKSLRHHEPVKGIYVSGPIAGHSRFKELLDMVETTELNAMVIDVKNDNGNVTYNMNHKLVNEFGANIRYIRGINAFLENLHNKNIYTIARVVAFRDPLLAKKKPEWCVHRKDGSIYYDRSGLAWVNPYNRDVWKYLVSIGKRAAADGFDEIQFDYIRFSTEVKDDEVNYGFGADTMSKQEVITEFVKYSASEFKKCGIEFSADVFGTVINNDVDTRLVGQNYAEMGRHLSTISPMIYPSHYGPNVFQIPIPNNEPYRAVFGAMNLSRKVLDCLDTKPNVRAWLQDFSAPWVKGARAYTPADVRAQIDAIYDAGYSEWILWNASVKYRKDALILNGDSIPMYKRYKKSYNNVATDSIHTEKASCDSAKIETIIDTTKNE